MSYRGGYSTWFSNKGSDPNVLHGALVGGPDQNDNFADERDNYEQTEPATYKNPPAVGVLARLHAGGSLNQFFQVCFCNIKVQVNAGNLQSNLVSDV